MCPPTSEADPTQICVFTTSISVLETAGDVDVPLRRRGNSSGVAKFDYRLIPDTAQAGLDYGDMSGTVSFAAGETERSVSVEIIENPGRTVDGSFIFEILNPVNAQLVSDFTQTRVNIIDVDDPDPNLGESSISLLTTEANVSENIGNVVLQVARMGDVSGAETVNFGTFALDAIEGVDYAFTSGVLSWAAGDGASKQISVPIFDNTIVEESRAFTVSLFNPLRGDIEPIGNTIVTILDDDAAPANAVIRMQQGVVSVSEDSGVANIGIGRFGNTSQPAQVIARTVSTGSAVLGTDITSRSQVIQWAAGDGQPKSLDVPIIDNDMPQDDRTFLVELVSPEGVTIGDPSSTLVTIVDDDEPGDRGTISFLSDIASVSEDAGSITLTLARFGDASSAASVVFSTADDLATSGIDYVQNTGLISWAAGESGVREITIDLIGNEVNDGNRTFLVSLNSPQGIDLGDNDSVLVTIIDNDAPAADPGILRITSDPEISVDRESGQVRITVERSGASGGSAAALLDLIPVNAVAGEDFDPAGLPALISWGPGENSARSVTIRLSTSDLLGEGTDGEFGIEPRQFIVTLTAVAPEGEPSALLPIVEPTADEVTVTIFTQEGPRNTGIGAGSMGGSSLLGFMLLSLIALRRRRLKAANAR